MGINIKGVLKGSAIAVFITGVLIFILALLSYFTNISENIITAGAYASVILGVLAGALLVSAGIKFKRFIHVMLVCIIYTAVITGVSFALNGNITFNTHMAAVIGGIFAAAFLGLIIGGR